MRAGFPSKVRSFSNLVKLQIFSRQIPINQNFTWNLKAFDEFQSLIIFAGRVESRFFFQSTEFLKSRQTTNIFPSDSHKPKLYLELKVIVEHREISIGDSILDFVSYSFPAFLFHRIFPKYEKKGSLNPQNLRVEFFGDEQKGWISTRMRHRFRPRVSGFLEQRNYTC